MMTLERELRRFVRQIRPGLIGATANPNTNLKQLVEEVRLSSHVRENLPRQLVDFLLTQDIVSALTEANLTLEKGIFSEIYQRLEYKVLPKPVENTDILYFLSRVFDSQSDANWLENIDRAKFAELLHLLFSNKQKLITGLVPQLCLALEILSLRLAGLGYDPVVNRRLRSRQDYQHAFLHVTRSVHGLLDGQGEAAIPQIREAIGRCASAATWARSRRKEDGVSMALTYQLLKIQQVTKRMSLILDVIEASLGQWKGESAFELFYEILLAEIRRFDIGRFIGQNIGMLAFQITEHTGKTGEHYITRSRREWNLMFQSAAIGGAIVAGLAVMKIILSHLHLPPGPEGLTYAMLYSIGFLWIHTMGGTLATKQPAMTASTLASSLDQAANSHQAMQNLCEVIVCTIRSQMIALLGNYLIAFPMAIFICLPFNSFKMPIMSHEKAWTLIESLHPWHSLAFFYAAVAGVGLCGAGLIAGFADNWFVFNRVGSRLKNSSLLRRFVSTRNLDRVIHYIDHNLGFWVGNVGLGFYLGLVGPIGKVFGLPLDTRHITFSSGQFGAAVASLDFRVPLPVLFTVGLAIFGFGLINLAVSFFLTLNLAVRSRGIRFGQSRELLRLLFKRFWAHPTEFFIPQRDHG